MISELAILSDLIGTIYDTTLDRALWCDVLRKSAEFVGGSASSLYSKNALSKLGNSVLHWNSKSDAPVSNDFDEYAKTDPVATGRFLFDVGQIFSVEDCIPYAEFVQTRVYREWARPHGVVDHLAAILEKSATGFSLFVIFRSEEQGRVDEEMRRRMRLIIPHVRRTVLIGTMLDLDASEKTAFADTLSGLAAGVFLVDEDARIVFANTSGRIMLDDGKILRQKDGVLTTVDPRTKATLPVVIAAALDGDAAVGANAISVPLSSPPAEPWLAHVLPLTSGMRQHAGLTCSAVAAVFVHRASLEIPSSMETMSKLYKLTPSEQRVLAALSEVGGVPAVAEVVGISQATVKTHLQGLFAKTGTHRQTDLVKLAAAHASPLRQAP
jgi:DNA-binding CsgD family transcriptional regulator